MTKLVCSANAAVDHPGRTGVRSRARASMRCCGLRGTRPYRTQHLCMMWEGQNFLAWQLGRCGADSLAALGVPDIDCYVDLRAPKPANSGTT